IAHPSFFVGLLLRNCQLPVANHGHVVLARPSPILFYPISSTEVRCLVDVPGERLPGDLPAYLRSTVAPQLPEQLRPAFLDALERPEAIRSMQNKLMPAAPLHQPGALLLGDAFNMRHPLTHLAPLGAAKPSSAATQHSSIALTEAGAPGSPGCSGWRRP
ncbi:Squalene monooxygenase, partial [Tetrabaena socialis]